MLMKTKSPYILNRIFEGEIAYTHQIKTPEEFIADGGFKNTHSLLSHDINTGSNSGSICLTMGGPSIAGIFTRESMTRRHFIYALPLYGEYLLPGSPWGIEVIAPGALAKPGFWIVREIMDISNGHLELGPLKGQLGKMPVIPGFFFTDFCNKSSVALPKTINWGDDVPLEYCIDLPPPLACIEKSIKNYYDELKNQPLTFNV